MYKCKTMAKFACYKKYYNDISIEMTLKLLSAIVNINFFYSFLFIYFFEMNNLQLLFNGENINCIGLLVNTHCERSSIKLIHKTIFSTRLNKTIVILSYFFFIALLVYNIYRVLVSFFL